MINHRTHAPDKPPEGFRTVSKDDFYATLYADKRDIMPKISSPYSTTWETTSRYVWGWTQPGWRNSGAPEVYALKG